jgi:hypothetical protein
MSSPDNTLYECESAIVFLCNSYDQIRALSRHLRQELYGTDLFGFGNDAFLSNDGKEARAVREDAVTLGDVFVPKNMMAHAPRKIDSKIYDSSLSVHDNIEIITNSSLDVDTKIKIIGEIALIEKEKELFLSSGLENKFDPSTADLSSTRYYTYTGSDGVTKYKRYYVSVDFTDPSSAPGFELFRAFCRIRNKLFSDNTNAIYCRVLRDKITGEKYFVESLVITDNIFVETNIPLAKLLEQIYGKDSSPLSMLGINYVKTLFPPF